MWERLGIAHALRSTAEGRRIDGDLVERICFALVAQRCLEPASKLAAVRWANERVAIDRCPSFDDQAAYAAMDFFLSSLPEIAERIFSTTANLLNLSCDVIFVDTTSTTSRSMWPTARPISTWPKGRPSRRAARTMLGQDRRSRPRDGSTSTRRTTAPTCPRW